MIRLLPAISAVSFCAILPPLAASWPVHPSSFEPIGRAAGDLKAVPPSGLLYLNLGRLLRTSGNSLGPLRSRRLRRRRSSSVANGSLRRSISWPAIARAFAALSVCTPAPWTLGPYIRRRRCRRHRYPSPSSRRISSAASDCRRGTKLGEIALARPCSSSSLPPPRASPPHTPGFSSSTNPASARSGSVSPCASTRCPPAPSCRHGRRPSGRLNRMPELALTTIDASVALRTSSGSRRRSSPFG